MSYLLSQLEAQQVEQMQGSRHKLVTVCSDAHRRPPPARVEMESLELEPRIYLHAIDEFGGLWGGMPPVLARMEIAHTSEGVELWLAGLFTWPNEGPSTILDRIKVSGWCADYDYLLTPQSPETQCEGKGATILVKVPTRILD